MSTTTNGISDGVAVPHNDSKFVAQSLIFKFSVSMALKAAVELGIPDILATAEGGKLPASEILAKLPTKSTPGRQSVMNLRRLLGPLVREEALSLSFTANNEPVYGLTEISKWFVKSDEANLLSIAAFNLNPVNFAAWQNLQEAILDEGSTPFEKAHGVLPFEYMKEKDPELGAQFQKIMASLMKLQAKALLNNIRQSGVIDGVTTLVDVGGNHGHLIGEIVGQHPHIKGINFDMPNVIASAPTIKGVEHVGGSFFETIPSGDAMLLKYIVHNHGDEFSIKILQNCFKALPKNGKVIVTEYCIQNENQQSSFGGFVATIDLLMLVTTKEGRERTKEEYLAILKAAGFARLNVIKNPGSLDFIVGFKD